MKPLDWETVKKQQKQSISTLDISLLSYQKCQLLQEHWKRAHYLLDRPSLTKINMDNIIHVHQNITVSAITYSSCIIYRHIYIHSEMQFNFLISPSQCVLNPMSPLIMCSPETGIGISTVLHICIVVLRSLQINRKCWNLTVYCPKARLCLKSRKQKTTEMTVWVKVKRKREAFTPLLSFCYKGHTTLPSASTTTTQTHTRGVGAKLKNQFIGYFQFH